MDGCRNACIEGPIYVYTHTHSQSTKRIHCEFTELLSLGFIILWVRLQRFILALPSGSPRLARVGAAAVRTCESLFVDALEEIEKWAMREHKQGRNSTEGGNGMAKKGKSTNFMFNLPSGELGCVGRVDDDSSSRRGLYCHRAVAAAATGRDADGDLLLLGAKFFVIVRRRFPSDGRTFSSFQLLPRTSGVLLLLLLFAVVDASGTGRFASVFAVRLHEQTLLVLMMSVVIHAGKTADVSTASAGNR